MTSKKILVVEDNEKNIKLMCIILNHLQIGAIIAKDGVEALLKLKKKNYDFVLMDIQLPIKSGLDVIKEVRQDPTLKNIYAVAVTAYSMDGDRQKLLDAGFDDYISKPIDLGSFEKKILAFYEQKRN